jgi:voltage-gated potassium channel Kch
MEEDKVASPVIPGRSRHRLVSMVQRWKIVVSLVLVLTATIGFRQIEVTGGYRYNWVEAVYQAVMLFILHPKAMPASGSAFWLVVMWCLYFLSPVITASVVLEYLYKIGGALRNPERSARRMENHIVVCGLGKHARLILSRMLAANPQYHVVVVDQDPTLPSFIEIAPRVTAPVIRGDMSEPETLRRASVERAAKLLAMSGHEVVNLNTCLAARRLNSAQAFKAIAIVSDIGLSAGVARLSRQEGIITLNPYEIAARNLVRKLRAERDGQSTWDSAVVVAGFGRFGQMFVKAVLDTRTEACEPRIAIIDKESIRLTELFKRHFHVEGECLKPVDGEIGDPRNIELALKGVDSVSPQTEPMIVLCTDNDATNLNTALLIRETWGIQAMVIARFFDPPPRFRELTADGRIRTFHISELIAHELPAECC